MKPIYNEEYTCVLHSPGIEPWVCRFLKSKRSLGRVLDVGCSHGYVLKFLRDAGADAYGLGVGLRELKAESPRNCFMADGENIPFKSGWFATNFSLSSHAIVLKL